MKIDKFLFTAIEGRTHEKIELTMVGILYKTVTMNYLPNQVNSDI